ncbi:MAG: RagB/SusD family nutrient uptake outer membrane protein [Bacteroidales bacterium]
MKKILGFIGIIILFMGCNEKMELPYDGRVPKDELFSDFNATRGMLNRAYIFLPGSGMPDYGIFYSGSMLASFCDEAQDAGYSSITSSGFRDWYEGRVTSSNMPLPGLWGGYYEGIRACNVFLEGIKTTTLNVSPEEIKGWIAQARTLRAFYYLQIIKRYGFAMLLDKEIDLSHDFSKDIKSSFNEVAAFILADCDSALAEPGSVFKWRYPGDAGNVGTMTRGIAYAIKSQTALYAASPLYQDGSISWDKAAAITADALYQCTNNGELDYTLYSNYKEYFSRSIDVTQSQDRETILSTRGQLEVWKYCGHPSTKGMEKTGPSPTQELVDCYEMTGTGLPPVTGYHDTKHLRPIYNPAVFSTVPKYDSLNPYNNRDPRLKASIYYLGNGLEIAESLTSAEENRINQTRTGYYIAKFNLESSNSDANNDGYMKIFRLAELYLNFAEAANEAYGPNVAVTIGPWSMTALQAVNVVRARAGMPDFGTTAGDNSASDQDAFRTKYRNERRVELAFEQHRFYDVRRWQSPEGDLSETDQYLTGIKSGSFKRFALPRRLAFDNKYLLMPLPADENNKVVELTGTSWQNSGW